MSAMASKNTPRDTPATPEDLSDLNARIAETAAQVTTAEARGLRTGEGLVDVTTADTPHAS
jgi:hypothetical protein